MTFAQTLHDLMAQKKFKAAHLARAVWGTKKDNRGYNVARNRDRIGHYLSGKSFPEPANLEKIAKALGVPAATLKATLPPPKIRAPRSNNFVLEIVVHPNKGTACMSGKFEISLAGGRRILQIIKNDPVFSKSAA